MERDSLLQGVQLPQQIALATQSLPEARDLPSEPVQRGYTPLEFLEPENREGEAKIRQRRRTPAPCAFQDTERDTSVEKGLSVSEHSCAKGWTSPSHHQSWTSFLQEPLQHYPDWSSTYQVPPAPPPAHPQSWSTCQLPVPHTHGWPATFHPPAAYTHGWSSTHPPPPSTSTHGWSSTYPAPPSTSTHGWSSTFPPPSTSNQPPPASTQGWSAVPPPPPPATQSWSDPPPLGPTAQSGLSHPALDPLNRQREWRLRKAALEDEERLRKGEPAKKRQAKESYHYECKQCGQPKTKQTGHSQVRGKWYCPASGQTLEEWRSSL